jgi:hypothetical protein
MSDEPEGLEPSLRKDLVAFARSILQMEAEDRLLRSAADLQTVMGELRRRLFAWETRHAESLRPPASSPWTDAEEGDAEGQDDDGQPG